MVYKIGDQMSQRLQDFGPQAIANTMLAQSKMNCYNAALFNAAPARIMQLLPRFSTQSLCSVAASYAMARHASDPLFKAINARIMDLGLASFSTAELASLAWSFASLSVPADEMLHSIAQQAAAAPGLWTANSDGQDLALLLWAMGVSNLLDHSLLQVLVKPLHEWGVVSKLDAQSLGMLYQVDLLAQCRAGAPALSQPNSPLVLHGELRDAAASAWKSSSEKARPSQLQLDVLRVLQDMQLRCVSEWRTPGSGLSVDILVEADGNRQLHPTAVEVDGPSHFTCNSPVRETGSTVVKRRLLRGHWPEGRVVHVPYFVWDQLQDDLAKTGYLTHLLLDRQ